MTLLDLPARRQRRAAKRPENSRNGAPLPNAWPRPRVRLTVDQYHKMIAEGILEEGVPIELLDGRLEWKDRSAAGEDPMTVGEDHAWSLDALNELNPKLRRLGCYARIQLPVTLPPHDEP